MGEHTSSTLILNVGIPQGCVEFLSPLLYSLFTHVCSQIHTSSTIIKFTDDTTVIGLIEYNNDSDFREEVQHMKPWCDNNLNTA